MKEIEKPIYLQKVAEADSHDLGLIQECIQAIEELIDVSFEVRDISDWRPTEKDYEGVNADWPEFSSPEWYQEMAELPERDQIDAGEVGFQLWREPWRRVYGRHWDVFLTNRDLTSRSDDEYLNFVVGAADPKKSTMVLSPYRFKEAKERLGAKLWKECFKTEAYHEFGHLFNAPDRDRRGSNTLEKSLGYHCRNRDVVRQGLTVPKDWIRMTNDRKETGVIYCDECIEDMQRYLSKF